MVQNPKEHITYSKFRYILYVISHLQFLCIHIPSVTRLCQLVYVVNTSEICEGNFDEKYLQLPNIHNNVMKNHSSELKVYIQLFLLILFKELRLWLLQILLVLAPCPFTILTVKCCQKAILNRRGAWHVKSTENLYPALHVAPRKMNVRIHQVTQRIPTYILLKKLSV